MNFGPMIQDAAIVHVACVRFIAGVAIIGLAITAIARPIGLAAAFTIMETAVTVSGKNPSAYGSLSSLMVP